MAPPMANWQAAQLASCPARCKVEDIEALVTDVQDHVFGELRMPYQLVQDIQTPGMLWICDKFFSHSFVPLAFSGKTQQQ